MRPHPIQFPCPGPDDLSFELQRGFMCVVLYRDSEHGVDLCNYIWHADVQIGSKSRAVAGQLKIRGLSANFCTPWLDLTIGDETACHRQTIFRLLWCQAAKRTMDAKSPVQT